MENIGDTDWFTLEPICMFCKSDFELKGSGYSGFIEAKCGCRSLSMNADVLSVLDELKTSAEKSLLMNGFVKMTRVESGTGQYMRMVVDVRNTAKEIETIARDMPLDREGLARSLQALRVARMM